MTTGYSAPSSSLNMATAVLDGYPFHHTLERLVQCLDVPASETGSV
jgi:hypothetical protein